MEQARTVELRARWCGDEALQAGRAATFDCPHLEPQPQVPARGRRWEPGPHRKEEEFTRAVALGLFDYLRKSRGARLRRLARAAAPTPRRWRAWWP